MDAMCERRDQESARTTEDNVVGTLDWLTRKRLILGSISDSDPNEVIYNVIIVTEPSSQCTNGFNDF